MGPGLRPRGPCHSGRIAAKRHRKRVELADINGFCAFSVAAAYRALDRVNYYTHGTAWFEVVARGLGPASTESSRCSARRFGAICSLSSGRRCSISRRRSSGMPSASRLISMISVTPSQGWKRCRAVTFSVASSFSSGAGGALGTATFGVMRGSIRVFSAAARNSEQRKSRRRKPRILRPMD